MYRKHIGNGHGVLKHFDFIVLDILAILAAFSVAYYFKFRDFSFLTAQTWRGILLVMCLTDLAVVVFTAQYSGVLRRWGSDELLMTLKNAVINFILCCLTMYVLKCGPFFSRTVMILTYLFYVAFSLLIRTLWKKAIRSNFSNLHGTKTIFVVGSRANMPQLLRSIGSDFLREYTVSGICVADGDMGEMIETQIDLEDGRGGVKIQKIFFENSASPENIAEYVLKHHVDEVFVGVQPDSLSTETFQMLSDNGKRIHLNLSQLIGFAPAGQYISTVGTYKTVTIDNHTMDGEQMVYMAVKRGLDLLLGAMGILLLLPLMMAVKLCYLLSGDKAPILYTQIRVGLNGETFKLYKFRSMVADADEILRELLQEPAYRQEWEQKQKFDHDPRITKVGAFLRKSSLDEIPQFLNVLKGDMSVIGPRPLVPGELEQHNGLQMYNDVKPGITGWWGCNGRSNTTYEERLALEYYYVEHFGLYLDLLCFVKTIVSIFSKKGAQ